MPCLHAGGARPQLWRGTAAALVCPSTAVVTRTGTQVGWLERGEVSYPVFMDGWFPDRREGGVGSGGCGGGKANRWRVRNALYVVNEAGSRDYLTKGFGADSPEWPNPRETGGYEPASFSVCHSQASNHRSGREWRVGQRVL